ncbi:MAG: [FeFe] hydrogenase H-cluster maturation GTPase HydF [Cyanobacteria bacterium SIG29]|nr:[FeFe] hydrogenase H-cluster maturation GTPase HydF [Cyanobacteria bacterium SIG29]
MNSTPNSQRIQIGFFGRINVGKSSVVNAITNQDLAVVSAIKGTTTDPVSKAMELLPLGPVNIIDTAGLDDTGELGLLRINKTKEVLNKVDIAILVADAQTGLTEIENELINTFKQKNINYIIVFNKSDLIQIPQIHNENEIYVSALKKTNIFELKELIAKLNNKKENENFLIKDIINKDDIVILVTPIDESAPKGRLILPQQQVIRELLEVGAITTIIKETQLEETLKKITPKVIITDSQVFGKVNKITPQNILLTSFSILFARYKGILKYAVEGVKNLENLKDNDTILISEGCTHHRQCNDIGSVKLPNWIKNHTNKNLNFEFTSGNTFPKDLSKYAMIIHCGACMLNEKEVLNRYEEAHKQNIPISNYGITIAYIHNILKRSIEIFPEIHSKLN